MDIQRGRSDDVIRMVAWLGNRLRAADFTEIATPKAPSPQTAKQTRPGLSALQLPATPSCQPSQRATGCNHIELKACAFYGHGGDAVIFAGP